MLNYNLDGSIINIETDCLQAQIHIEGYVSVFAAGAIVDKQTGSSDLGFGLIMLYFLL